LKSKKRRIATVIDDEEKGRGKMGKDGEDDWKMLQLSYKIICILFIFPTTPGHHQVLSIFNKSGKSQSKSITGSLWLANHFH